jgi:hypothetical protein
LSESVDLHAPSTDTLEEPMVKELPVLSTSELESLDQEGIKRDINLIEAEKNKFETSVNLFCHPYTFYLQIEEQC